MTQPVLTLNDVRITSLPRKSLGGMQPVRTDSGVRVTHTASGLVVEVDTYRNSQHKNLLEAMSKLQEMINQQHQKGKP